MEVANPNASIPVVMAGNMMRFKKMYSGCRKRHKEKYEGEMIAFERFGTIYQAQGRWRLR